MEFLELAEALAEGANLDALLEHLEFVIGDQVIADEALGDLALGHYCLTVKLLGEQALSTYFVLHSQKLKKQLFEGRK